MARTVSKGVRLDEDDMEVVGQLLRRFKHYRTEADLLYHACVRGLRDLAIEAGSSGETPYGGLDPNELADDAELAILRLYSFLVARQRMPVFLGQVVSATATPLPVVHNVLEVPQQIIIDSGAADDIEELGGGFLDD